MAVAYPSDSALDPLSTTPNRLSRFNGVLPLVGQGEELTDGLRVDLAHGLEQPLDHATEQLVGLEVQRRLRHPR